MIRRARRVVERRRSALQREELRRDRNSKQQHGAIQRAYDDGAIGRFDAVDPSDGGRSHRYSLSGELQRSALGGQLRSILYGVKGLSRSLRQFHILPGRHDSGRSDQSARGPVDARLERAMDAPRFAVRFLDDE
jgi:hypothetical protein